MAHAEPISVVGHATICASGSSFEVNGEALWVGTPRTTSDSNATAQ